MPGDRLPDYPMRQNTRGRSAAIWQVESNKLTPMLVVLAAFALLLAGIALGVSWWATNSYRELERENRLLQLKVDEFRMALINARIDPNPHVEGESK